VKRVKPTSEGQHTQRSERRKTPEKRVRGAEIYKRVEKYGDWDLGELERGENPKGRMKIARADRRKRAKRGRNKFVVDNRNTKNEGRGKRTQGGTRTGCKWWKAKKKRGKKKE